MASYVGTLLPLIATDFVKNYPFDPIEGQLLDGNLDANPVPTYNPIHPLNLEIWVKRFAATVTKVEIYDKFNNGFNTEVIAVREDTGAEVPLGTYTGNGYDVWAQFPIASTFVTRKIILRSTNGGEVFGSEVRITANWTDPVPFNVAPFKKKEQIGKLMGFCAHWWNLADNAKSEALQSTTYNSYIAAIDLKPTSIRIYGDATRYNPGPADVYHFNPINGGWYEDTLLQRLKTDLPGIVAWPVVQGQSNHINQGWSVSDTSKHFNGTVTQYDDYGTFGNLKVQVTSNVANGFSGEWWVELTSAPAAGKTAADYRLYVIKNLTVPLTVGSIVDLPVPETINFQVGDTVAIYGAHSSSLNFPYSNNNPTDRKNVATWAYMGKMAFVFASRRGTNTAAPNYSVGSGTSVVKGNGANNWWEGGNEVVQPWNGYDDTLLPEEWFAMLSMMHDGHKGAYPTCGVKNADPNFKHCASGLAHSTLDMIKKVHELSKANRGLRADGYVDLPFDAYQVHHYSYTGGSNQYAGGVNGGLPPELGAMLHEADDLANWFAEHAPWVELWMGEYGWDSNQSSPMNAPAIGALNVEQVRGAWCVRAILGMAEAGFTRAQWFRAYQNDETSSDATQFASMSLLSFGTTIQRRTVGHYWKQLTEFQGYAFDARLSATPRVLRFKQGTKVLVAIWGVEALTSAAGAKPTFSQTTGTYNLPLTSGTNINVRSLQEVGDAMTVQSATTSGATHPITYGTKPVFVAYDESGGNAPVNTVPVANAGADKSVTLPTSSTVLVGAGVDPENGALTYLWTKVSGPAGGVISSPSAATTNVVSLQQGTYVFRLRVTDVGGLFAEDDVTVTVNAAAAPAPVNPNPTPVPKKLIAIVYVYNDGTTSITRKV